MNASWSDEFSKDVAQGGLIPANEQLACIVFRGAAKNKLMPISIQYYFDKGGESVEEIDIIQIDPDVLPPVCK